MKSGRPLTAEQQRLVEGSLDYAYKLAWGYIRTFPNAGVIREDLFQAAHAALVEAAALYQQTDVPFHVYASQHIMGALRAELRFFSSPMYLPLDREHGGFHAPLERGDDAEMMGVPGLDGGELEERYAAHELGRALTEGLASQVIGPNSQRDARLYAEHVLFEVPLYARGRELGMHSKSIDTLSKRMQRAMERWAGALRAEAA